MRVQVRKHNSDDENDDVADDDYDETPEISLEQKRENIPSMLIYSS